MPNWYNGIEGLYSRLEKAVSDLAGKQGGKQSGLSWLNYLGKHSDVPKAEMDATGLVKYLTDNKGNVLEAGDVSKYLEANRLPLGEMQLNSGPNTGRTLAEQTEWFNNHSPTQYEQYQLKGKPENYREFLYHSGDTGEDARGAYSAPHFDDLGENLAFHVRSSDRTAGNRSLRHVDEVQSDWAQAARDRGTYDPANPYEVWDPQTNRVLGRYPDITGAEEENMRRFAERHQALRNVRTDADAIRLETDNPLTDFGHAADTGENRVPKTPWAEEQGGIPFYVRAALNRQIYDAAKQGKEGLTWTTGAQQIARYPGMNNPAGMEQFYDQKIPKAVARDMRRLGYNPEELIGTTELPGEAPNARRLMDVFSARQASPLWNTDVFANEQRMRPWLNSALDAAGDAGLGRTAFEEISPLRIAYNQGMPHEEWRQLAADAYQRLLGRVQPQPQKVHQLDLSDPALREKIIREGLPIMSLGTLGVKSLYDQAQTNPLSALNPGASEDGI